MASRRRRCVIAEARRDLAQRHGFSSWRVLTRHVEALRDETEPPTPFVLAYRAVEDGDRERSSTCSTGTPSSSGSAARTATTCSAWPTACRLVRLLLERGADPNRGNDYGWTKLHQAGYSNRRELAQLMLDAGGRIDLSARGDGGTPLVAALFWGHRDVVDLLGREPRNLRVAAGLGDLDLIRELAGTAEAGAHRGFYRPHGGFPAWEPSDDPQEVVDEALVWAAKADRVEALSLLVELGARVDADPYRGTPLAWAAANGRVAAIRELIALGADPDQRGTFGGPDARRGRHRDPARGAVGKARGRRSAARARCRPGDPRRDLRRAGVGLGEVRRERRDRRACSKLSAASADRGGRCSSASRRSRSSRRFHVEVIEKRVMTRWPPSWSP